MTSAYLNNILVPSDLGHIIDEIHGELESLQANENTHGDRFKKLKGHDNLYSLRLSNTARLLFLHINGILILVDKFEKHGDYERKLKKHKLAEHYLKHFGITSDISNIELYEEIEEEKSSELASHLLGIERPQLQVAELNLSNIVIFDETQLSINLNKANIVVGMPGSGKTSVAARLCEQAYKEVLNQHQAFSEETNYEIAYVTENKQLAIKVQDFFALLDQHAPNLLLKSYDYASFAKKMCPDALENKEEKRETDFISWCHDKQLYKEKSFKEKILSTIELSKKREQRSEQLKELYSRIYTEFKIISAFTEESDYTHAGKKKSLLTDDSEVKAYLFKLYQSYISSFGEESYDLNFFDINANKSANDTPDIIFADECQLGSYRMFEGLMQMCKSPQNVHFFGDTHQNIYGATPFDTFIESLWNTYEIKGKKTSLNASYRIPEAVLPVANALLLLKNYSYGSQSKDSYTSLQLSKEISQTGGCHLWEKKSLGESQQILTSLCESANTAIVTNDPGQIEHIKSSYGTSLVFTPDQILGQEFSTIISIEPFSDPIFRSIENHCSGALNHQPTSHYPKKSDNKVISKEAVATLNAAYVTLTRAQTQLFIIYSQQELVMVDYLRQKISLKSQHQHSSVIEESDGKSAEAWRKRAEHLKKDGNIDLADEIMNGKRLPQTDIEESKTDSKVSHLKKTKSEIEKELKSTKKPASQKQRALSKADKNRKRNQRRKEAKRKARKKEGGEKMANHQSHSVLPHPSLIQKQENTSQASAFIMQHSRFMISELERICQNEEFYTMINKFIDLYLSMIKFKNTNPSIFLDVLTKKLSNENHTSEEIKEILKDFLISTYFFASINNSLQLKKDITKYLTYENHGISLTALDLKRIMAKTYWPELRKNIVSDRYSSMLNKTPLKMLTDLNLLIDKKPKMITDDFIEALFIKSENNNPSVASHIIYWDELTNIIEKENRIKTQDKLTTTDIIKKLCQYARFKDSFIKVLFDKNEVASSSKDNKLNSLNFSLLLITNERMFFLIQLITKNSLWDDIPVTILSESVPGEESGLTVFHCFCETKESVKFMTTLHKEKPGVLENLTLKLLNKNTIYPETHDLGLSPLMKLSITEYGIRFLSEILVEYISFQEKGSFKPFFMLAYNPDYPDNSISIFSNLIENSDGCNFLVGQMKKINSLPKKLSTYVVNLISSTLMERIEHGKNILISLLTTQHGHDVLWSLINPKTKLSNQLTPRLIEELNTTYQEKNNDNQDIQSILKGTHKGKQIAAIIYKEHSNPQKTQTDFFKLEKKQRDPTTVTPQGDAMKP